MQPDPLTRILLIVIALCLLALVSQGFVAGSTGRTGAVAAQTAQDGRYRVNVIKPKRKAAVTLMRTDTATGDVWLMDDLFADQRAWAPAETPPVPPMDEEAAAAPDGAETRAFVEMLSGAGPTEMRVFAAEQLGAADPAVALLPLVGALDDDDPAVVIAAVQALAHMGDPRGRQALERLRSHANPGVRVAVEEALSGD